MALKPFLIQVCCDCNTGFKIYHRITHKLRAYLDDPIFHSSSGLTETALPRADGQHQGQAQLCSHMYGIQCPENFSDSTATTGNMLLSSPKSKSPSELQLLSRESCEHPFFAVYHQWWSALSAFQTTNPHPWNRAQLQSLVDPILFKPFNNEDQILSCCKLRQLHWTRSS